MTTTETFRAGEYPGQAVDWLTVAGTLVLAIILFALWTLRYVMLYLAASEEVTWTWIGLRRVGVGLAALGGFSLLWVKLLPTFLRNTSAELRAIYTLEADETEFRLVDAVGRVRRIPWSSIKELTIKRQFFQSRVIWIRRSQGKSTYFTSFGALFPDAEREAMFAWLKAACERHHPVALARAAAAEPLREA